VASGWLERVRDDLETSDLECGVLGRRIRTPSVIAKRVVRGSGSAVRRRMCATAANLIAHVLPGNAAARWRFTWRRRLAQNESQFSGYLSRIFVPMAEFYGGKTGRAYRDGALLPRGRRRSRTTAGSSTSGSRSSRAV
jgi:hypothetical protein